MYLKKDVCSCLHHVLLDWRWLALLMLIFNNTQSALCTRLALTAYSFAAGFQ